MNTITDRVSRQRNNYNSTVEYDEFVIRVATLEDAAIESERATAAIMAREHRRLYPMFADYGGSIGEFQDDVARHIVAGCATHLHLPIQSLWRNIQKACFDFIHPQDLLLLLNGWPSISTAMFYHRARFRFIRARMAEAREHYNYHLHVIKTAESDLCSFRAPAISADFFAKHPITNPKGTP